VQLSNRQRDEGPIGRELGTQKGRSCRQVSPVQCRGPKPRRHEHNHRAPPAHERGGSSEFVERARFAREGEKADSPSSRSARQGPTGCPKLFFKATGRPRGEHGRAQRILSSNLNHEDPRLDHPGRAGATRTRNAITRAIAIQSSDGMSILSKRNSDTRSGRKCGRATGAPNVGAQDEIGHDESGRD